LPYGSALSTFHIVSILHSSEPYVRTMVVTNSRRAAVLGKLGLPNVGRMVRIYHLLEFVTFEIEREMKYLGMGQHQHQHHPQKGASLLYA
jgi:hypothetical protein